MSGMGYVPDTAPPFFVAFDGTAMFDFEMFFLLAAVSFAIGPFFLYMGSSPTLLRQGPSAWDTMNTGSAGNSSPWKLVSRPQTMHWK